MRMCVCVYVCLHTNGVVTEVPHAMPQFPLMNFHGKMWAKCRARAAAASGDIHIYIHVYVYSYVYVYEYTHA